MRWQWIYLSNIRHGSHKGGTNRPTGAYQVAIQIGFTHQPLSNQIQHRKTMGYNWL